MCFRQASSSFNSPPAGIPFSSRDRSLGQVVSAIVFEPPPKLSEICPDAPEGLEFLLNRALEKDPERRTPNGSALKQAVSLCRVTLELARPLSSAPVAPASGGTPAPSAHGVEGEKTSLLPRFAGSAVPTDPEKTKVIRRGDIPVAPLVNRPATPPVPVKPPAAQTRPLEPQAARFRYCPSCTFANSLSALACAGCGLPLANLPAGERPRPWSLYIAIAVAVLLAIVLLIVLVVRR